MRSDRVMRRPTPTLKEYTLAPQGGRPPKHGKDFRFAKPETWGEPDAATTQVTDRYGTARAMAWDRIHPRLTTRSAWIDHTGELPIIEGTLIRLQVDRLPGGGDPLPLWLWSSATGLNSEDADVRWQAFLRRFDIEHLFRLMKQTLGWTRPKLRTLEAGERWTWLIIAAHTQIRLLREVAADLRRPWEPPPAPALPRPCTETLNSRPWKAIWLEEPAARHPLRRGQDRETTREHHPTKPTQTIKIKLSECAGPTHGYGASCGRPRHPTILAI
jgi:hypothetical protein